MYLCDNEKVFTVIIRFCLLRSQNRTHCKNDTYTNEKMLKIHRFSPFYFYSTKLYIVFGNIYRKKEEHSHEMI